MQLETAGFFRMLLCRTVTAWRAEPDDRVNLM